MEPKLKHEKGGEALYVQIKNIYKDRILKGELQDGDRVDSESEIQQIFGVSRITARQAILDLEKDGMVKRGRGRGTFVCWPGPGREADYLNRSVKYHGTAKGVCSCQAEVRQVRRELCQVFGLPESPTMYCFKRLQKTATQNLFYAETYYPMELSLPDLQSSSSHVLLEMAHQKTRALTVRVEEEIGVQIPSSRIRRILNINGDVPILMRKRIARSKDDVGLEMTICYYRGDVCSLSASF